MSNTSVLKEQLKTKMCLIQDITLKISVIVIRVNKLSQNFLKESARIQRKINKVQFSRPRGNHANQWPHRPMTSNIRAFYQIKARKERDLLTSKDLIQHVFNHDKAILTSEQQALENEKRDIESQIRQIRIQLNLPINLDNLY